MGHFFVQKTKQLISKKNKFIERFAERSFFTLKDPLRLSLHNIKKLTKIEHISEEK